MWSRATDGYQPGCLGSCFLSADADPRGGPPKWLRTQRISGLRLVKPQHSIATLWRAREAQPETSDGAPVDPDGPPPGEERGHSRTTCCWLSSGVRFPGIFQVLESTQR